MTLPTVHSLYDDNFILVIEQDGVEVTPNVITRTVFWIPGDAFTDKIARAVDTNGPALIFNSTHTRVTVNINSIGIIPGMYTGKFVVFDAVNIQGLPWGQIKFRLANWAFKSGDGVYVPGEGASSIPPYIANNYTATTNIGGHIAVIADTGGVSPASSSNLDHVSSVIGITNAAVTTGGTVEVVTSGSITEPSWNWTPGEPVFLSSNGTLSHAVPSIGFILQMGVASSATSISMLMRQPIILV